MKIQVETQVMAPLAHVWSTYTSPSHIKQWNAASDDWHTTDAQVDLREGGAFSSRMEAKDGSMGFDFAGVYTKVEPLACIEYRFGDRHARVDFTANPSGTLVRVKIDPETEHPVEMQRDGWQAILTNFAKHAAATSAA